MMTTNTPPLPTGSDAETFLVSGGALPLGIRPVGAPPSACEWAKTHRSWLDAALLSPPYDFYAKKRGFREVLNVGSYARMPFGGLTVMNTTLRNRADELKKVIRAMQIAKQ